MNQKKAGVILSYLGQLIHIISGIIYTPIMLRLLGQSEYGLYQLVYSVVSYLSLLSLGFGVGYMRFYSQEKAKGDDDGVARVNGMFLLIFLVISVICILCGIIMITNIHTIFGEGLNDSEYKIAKILMAVMILNLALTFPNSIFNSIISSQERFFFQKMISLLQYLLNPFLTLPLLLAGFGSIGMVVITTILTIFVLASNIYYCFKKLHSRFLFTNLKFSLLKEMWVFTFFIFLNQIIDQINWSVDKFLLGRMSGTVSVAIYGVGSQINTLYIQFASTISSVFIPKVNRIVAETNDNESLTSLFVRVGRIQFMLMSLILTGFIFFGKPFVGFWAGMEYSDAYYVILLLICPVTIPLIQTLGLEIQRAKNKHQARSIVYFFIAIINIFISIPLIKIFGPVGAALGTTIALFSGNGLFMNWYYHKKLGINICFFWKSIAKIIPALIIPIIFGIISMRIEYSNILVLLIMMSFYTIVFSTSMYFLGMNKVEKEIIDGPVKKIFVH